MSKNGIIAIIAAPFVANGLSCAAAIERAQTLQRYTKALVKKHG